MSMIPNSAPAVQAQNKSTWPSVQNPRVLLPPPPARPAGAASLSAGGLSSEPDRKFRSFWSGRGCSFYERSVELKPLFIFQPQPGPTFFEEGKSGARCARVSRSCARDSHPCLRFGLMMPATALPPAGQSQEAMKMPRTR